MFPQPVLIVAAYDSEGKPNAMNAAWGGISQGDEISLCLSIGHKTVKNIKETGAFTVSMADAAHEVECDYLGVASGNSVEDKLGRCGFTATKSEKVNAPIINELPITLECRLRSIDESAPRIVGEIVNVSVDDSIVREDGSIDIGKARLISFDPANSKYRLIGEEVGNAFSDGNKLK